MTTRTITLLLTAVLFLFFQSCKQQNDNTNVTVNCKIENIPEGTKVFLLFKGIDKIEKIDSIETNAPEFTLKGYTDEIAFFGIQFEGNPYVIFILANPDDTISINANFNNLKNYTVKGSFDSDLIRQLQQQIDKTNTLLEIATMENNYSKIDSIVKNQRLFSENFIKKYDSSLTTIVALSQKFANGEPVLPIESHYDIYKNVEKNLRKKYGRSDYYLKYVEFIKNYEIKINRDKPVDYQKKRPTEMVDFTTKTIDGKEFKLSSLKGNWILLNFWTSWCLTCPQVNQQLKQLDNNPKLKIVQISLDADTKILNDTLKKYNFNHILINDTKVWKSEIVNLYNINNLPTNILINPQGKIVAYDFQLKDIEKYLK